MTAVIPNCIKYDPKDATNCLECDHYLHFGRVTKRCECEEGTGRTCNPGFSCGLWLEKCVPQNQCLQDENCTACVYTDHTRCYMCREGYFVTPDGQSCVTRETCSSVKDCRQCSLTEPKKCSSCKNFLFLSSDGSTCECIKNSGMPCQDGFSCAVDKRKCVRINSCKTEVPNCKDCAYKDESKCYRCNSGYNLVDNKCIKLDDCFTASPLCEYCDPSAPNTCLKCKNGLSVGPDHVTCECTLGTKQACHADQICAKHYHICVEKQACLSFPSQIQGCLNCNANDPRFCFTCDKDTVISFDRLRCVSKEACMTIRGCTTCNVIQAELCFECEASLTKSSDGLQCYCGQEGNFCKDGEKCSKGSCQLVVVNKTSAGQTAGIIIVVLMLVGVIAGLVAFIFIQKKSKSSNKPKKDIVGSFSRSMH